jgi:protein-disulfide isomerase
MSDEPAILRVPISSRDHVHGADDAPVTLVEYGDYECPHCGHAHPIVQEVQRRLGGALRFIFRNFPLSELHPHAVLAAEPAEAAADQGRFWQMHDLLFENQRTLQEPALIRYAAAIGIDDERGDASSPRALIGLGSRATSLVGSGAA